MLNGEFYIYNKKLFKFLLLTIRKYFEIVEISKMCKIF